MADEWPTVASEYRIIEQIGQVTNVPRALDRWIRSAQS